MATMEQIVAALREHGFVTDKRHPGISNLRPYVTFGAEPAEVVADFRAIFGGDNPSDDELHAAYTGSHYERVKQAANEYRAAHGGGRPDAPDPSEPPTPTPDPAPGDGFIPAGPEPTAAENAAAIQAVDTKLNGVIRCLREGLPLTDENIFPAPGIGG